MKHLKLFFSFLLFVFLFVPGFTQTKKITGKITNAAGVPLEGVTIKVKSSGKGTRTSKEGVYSIEASEHDVLEVSSVGYVIKSVPTTDLGEMNIQLETSYANLEEVIMVGA